MASIHPPSPTDFSSDSHKLEIGLVRKLVTIINKELHVILENGEARETLKLKSTSRLKNIQSQEFFEFSEHSVLSNLYWGIELAEAAAQAKCVEERSTRLENCEKMLQIPASLDENGVTLGIENSCLVCYSFFYLSVVELLRKNEWQVAVHFLQAVSVAPRLVYSELAPGICRSLLNGSVVENVYSDDDDGLKSMARRFKPWLMYYQIMCVGNKPENVVCPTNKGSMEILDSWVNKAGLKGCQIYEKIVPLNSQNEESLRAYAKQKEPNPRNSYSRATARSSSIKFLRDILTESEPDSPISIHSDSSSLEDFLPQDQGEGAITSFRATRIGADYQQLEANETKALVLRRMEGHRHTQLDDYSCSISSKNYKSFSALNRRSLSSRNDFPDVYLQPEENFVIEQSGVVQRIISKLCFTEELGNAEEDYAIEMKTIYEMLNMKQGLQYSILKDIILDQLLIAIATSKEERVVRTSVSILSTIATGNRSVIEDIKKKGLQLYDLATALKRNVHEAVVLIYLINPSPAEIKTLELLPCLLEVVCASKSSKLELTSLLLTPPAASLMIIEVLVTAFDYETNSMHLAAISSPKVLSGLLQVPRQDNLEEFISLASILVKCMRFDGESRKYISEISPVGRFVSLLWSNQRRATSMALEFFNELHKMPRSSAIALLEQIQNQGSINNMCALFLLIQNSEPEYRLLAANLLLQLDVLEEASMKCVYKEAAAKALFDSLTCEESSATEALSAFILSNLGGTYSWSGDPYTIAWLVKKTGLTSAHHRNLIKNYDFLDQCLQDAGIDSWCSKIAQRILLLGDPVFHALDKGLTSKLKRVSRDCLVAAAWLGCELVKCQDELRNAACEILLHTVEQFVHPGFELEERLLACLCIYSYTSGRGLKKIVNLSEGTKESLRRLSDVTWMAEELLKVADYFQPNKWRISCVHSQTLEAGNKSCGAVTALIFYKGLLYAGYADGSIKAWDIKGHTATLIQEMKEHRKAVTCFALYEPGNCLLSGSADKTIKEISLIISTTCTCIPQNSLKIPLWQTIPKLRANILLLHMWQSLHGNLECIEVIPTKESIRRIDSWGELIFVATQSYKLKIIDVSRKVKDIFKNKKVKCIKVAQGKIYAGCTDSSIQELMIINNRQQEMKPPSKSWMQNKPITSVAIYKNWLYCASSSFEGSTIKDWRRSIKPQISTVPEKGGSIMAMEVVEDFIYLNCSTSMSSLQIWLRGAQHKVGRLSAGSKITSILSANDMILCGTEKGLIKGWIPL